MKTKVYLRICEINERMQHGLTLLRTQIAVSDHGFYRRCEIFSLMRNRECRNPSVIGCIAIGRVTGFNPLRRHVDRIIVPQGRRSKPRIALRRASG